MGIDAVGVTEIRPSFREVLGVSTADGGACADIHFVDETAREVGIGHPMESEVGVGDIPGEEAFPVASCGGCMAGAGNGLPPSDVPCPGPV